LSRAKRRQKRSMERPSREKKSPGQVLRFISARRYSFPKKGAPPQGLTPPWRSTTLLSSRSAEPSQESCCCPIRPGYLNRTYERGALRIGRPSPCKLPWGALLGKKQGEEMSRPTSSPRPPQPMRPRDKSQQPLPGSFGGDCLPAVGSISWRPQPFPEWTIQGYSDRLDEGGS